MMSLSAISDSTDPAIRRLMALAPLDQDDVAVLQRAADTAVSTAARRDLTKIPAGTPNPILILSGWAHRSCLLADGRRQITEILLPGDVVVDDLGDAAMDLSVTEITAVTHCLLSADRIAARPGLAAAIHASRAIEGGRLRRHILRLGRMDALERVTDWLLDLHDRLHAIGLCSGDTMPLPVTQEIMADVLGLTSVHVNRMLAVLRREGLLNVQGARAIFLDRDGCRAMVQSR